MARKSKARERGPVQEVHERDEKTGQPTKYTELVPDGDGGTDRKTFEIGKDGVESEVED